MVSPSAHLGGTLVSIVVSFILPSIECDLSMAQLMHLLILSAPNKCEFNATTLPFAYIC